MKNRSFAPVVVGAALIISGCGDGGNAVAPELNQSKQGAFLAAATKTEFEGIETTCSIVNPGDEKISDGILHIRGQIFTTIIESAEARFAGTNTIVFNAKIKLATGRGKLFGTFSLNPDAVAGTWEGRFHGKFTNGLLSARAVGRGAGDLKGQKIKVNIQEFPRVAGDPASPCPPDGPTITRDNGFIIDPHAD